MEYANQHQEKYSREELSCRKPVAYELVVVTFKNLGRCAKHKEIDMIFRDELEDGILSQCLDLALELGDLVMPTSRCVCVPEFAEKSHLDDAGDEWDDTPF